MKNNILLIVLLFSTIGFSQKAALTIPANQSVEVDYPGYNFYTATLNNQSKQSINVAVIDKLNDTQVRGFGLGPKGKENVMVEKANKLVIQNQSNSDVKVLVSIEESGPMPEMPDKEYISFTLRNTSMKSIPLLIPSVMNPNLSPNSRSGVDLKIGQEIYFKQGGKKYVLLKVDNTMEDGQEIDVPELIKERKQELGLKD